MSVQNSPCDWPVSYAQCTTEGGALPVPLASMPASGVEMFETMAAEYLWRWTGRALGLCEVTINPCRQDCTEGQSSFYGGGPFRGSSPWTPVLVQGRWLNIGCGHCGDSCGCAGDASLRIPGPVDSLVRVVEDGVEVDPAVLGIYNNSFITRSDGKAWSPCGLEITYRRGTAVPVGGQTAAGILAVELAKAACSDNTCQLPKRVQTVTRQGVTIAMLDSFDDIDKGHTGIWLIDSWLASMIKPRQPSAVLSPDIPRNSPRRRTWP